MTLTVTSNCVNTVQQKATTTPTSLNTEVGEIFTETKTNNTKNEKEIALLIETILSDNALKQKILNNQNRILEKLQYDIMSDKFESLLMGFIDEMDVDNK